MFVQLLADMKNYNNITEPEFYRAAVYLKISRENKFTNKTAETTATAEPPHGRPGANLTFVMYKSYAGLGCETAT